MTTRRRLPNHVLEIVEAIETDCATIINVLKPITNGENHTLSRENAQLRALRAENAALRILEAVRHIEIEPAHLPEKEREQL